MGEPGLFFTLTTEPKKQQFMHAALSKMHDLYQLYAIKKTLNIHTSKNSFYEKEYIHRLHRYFSRPFKQKEKAQRKA